MIKVELFIALVAVIIALYAAWSARITEKLLDKMIGIVEEILDVMSGKDGDHQ